MSQGICLKCYSTCRYAVSNSIDILKDGRVSLTYHSLAGDYANTRCYFNESQSSRLAETSGGQEVIVEGTVRGFGADGRGYVVWKTAFGDPLMDLGTTLGYCVDADDSEEWQRFGFGLTKLPGSLSRSKVLEYYARLSGSNMQHAVCLLLHLWTPKDRGHCSANLFSFPEGHYKIPGSRISVGW